MPRERLFSRLPVNTRRFDSTGVHERYLDAHDSSFDRAHGKVAELHVVRDVDNTPDRFVDLLADPVGHEWRSDKDHHWNRARIRHAIPRASYKGTREALKDLILEHGGGSWSVKDMASTLWVLGKQGRLGMPDCYLLAPDYHHDGAFVLTFTTQVDKAAFLRDFALQIGGGEVWTFVVAEQQLPVFEVVWQVAETVYQGDTNMFDGRLGRCLLGVDLFLGCEPNGLEQYASEPVYWDHDGTILDGSLGRATLGVDLFLGCEPSGLEQYASEPVYWDHDGTVLDGRLGRATLGVDLFLGCEPNGLQEETVTEQGAAVAGGYLGTDSVLPVSETAITTAMGDADNPLPGNVAVIQLDPEIT